jgi:DNA-binding MarR family transcriptional regulator
MTATQTPTVRFGELLGVAARHSSTTFERILADADTPFVEWVAFTYLTRLGGVSPKGDLIADIATRIQQDTDVVSAAIERLIGRRMLGTVDANGTTLVELTAEGAEFYRALGAKVDEFSAFELSTSSPEDIAAARRVLRQFSEQAELLSR